MIPSSICFVIVLTSYEVASGSGRYEYGATVTLSIFQTTVDHGNGTRRIFKGWYEDSSLLSRDPQFSLVVRKPNRYSQPGIRSIFVSASSPYGSVTGLGWYARGSTATSQ
ncbi:MAG: hypothetical protein QXS66_01890 [Thermoproteota archaeon]